MNSLFFVDQFCQYNMEELLEEQGNQDGMRGGCGRADELGEAWDLIQSRMKQKLHLKENTVIEPARRPPHIKRDKQNNVKQSLKTNRTKLGNISNCNGLKFHQHRSKEQLKLLNFLADQQNQTKSYRLMLGDSQPENNAKLVHLCPSKTDRLLKMLKQQNQFHKKDQHDNSRSNKQSKTIKRVVSIQEEQVQCEYAQQETKLVSQVQDQLRRKNLSLVKFPKIIKEQHPNFSVLNRGGKSQSVSNPAKQSKLELNHAKMVLKLHKSKDGFIQLKQFQQEAIIKKSFNIRSLNGAKEIQNASKYQHYSTVKHINLSKLRTASLQSLKKRHKIHLSLTVGKNSLSLKNGSVGVRQKASSRYDSQSKQKLSQKRIKMQQKQNNLKLIFSPAFPKLKLNRNNEH